MRILALENTDQVGSVALLDDARLACEMPLPAGQRSAQSLAPSIDRLLRQAQWRPDQIELVAVANGPGSFTSLRVAVTTAKTLAYAIGCPLLGVNTLEAVAEQTPPQAEHVAAVLPAERGELFAARLVRELGSWRWLEPTHVVARAQWLAELPAGIWVCGPGLRLVERELPTTIHVGPANDWQPRASTVGLLARRHFLSDRRDDPLTLLPQYFRRTAAEEVWERKRT